MWLAKSHVQAQHRQHNRQAARRDDLELRHLRDEGEHNRRLHPRGQDGQRFLRGHPLLKEGDAGFGDAGGEVRLPFRHGHQEVPEPQGQGKDHRTHVVLLH